MIIALCDITVIMLSMETNLSPLSLFYVGAGGGGDVEGGGGGGG